MSTPTKPPPKPHRKGQRPQNKDAAQPPRDNASRRSPHEHPERKPKPAQYDAVEGYTKKPFRKREDNPLLDSTPRKTRYAARFEPKAKPVSSAGSAQQETTPNSARRGEVSAPSQGSDAVRRMRESPARSTAAYNKVREDARTEETSKSSSASLPIRLAKRMSDAGVCSRREAERLIEAGRVTVNGIRITACATLVSAQDMVRLDNTLVKNTAQVTRLFLFHKPRGALTTNADPEGRPTIYDLLPKDLPRVVSVGRLDFDSEGLLLLTTSGALARTLELPATGLARTYRVRVHGTPSAESLAKLRRGMEVDGVRYGAMEVYIEATENEGRNRWVRVTLREGKNREIRRVFTALSHHVTRLIRTHYGPFELGKLPRGALIEMKPRDWKKSLRDVLPQSE